MNRETSIFSTIGASNHAKTQREKLDNYSTPTEIAEMIDDLVPLSRDVWECACGEGNISKALLKRGHCVFSSDIVYRGFPCAEMDFLKTSSVVDMDIVTNPPYCVAFDFIKKSLEVITDDHYACFFLRLNFLEGKKRREFFNKFPPKYVFVSSSRISCGRSEYKGKSAVA